MWWRWWVGAGGRTGRLIAPDAYVLDTLQEQARPGGAPSAGSVGTLTGTSAAGAAAAAEAAAAAAVARPGVMGDVRLEVRKRLFLPVDEEEDHPTLRLLMACQVRTRPADACETGGALFTYCALGSVYLLCVHVCVWLCGCASVHDVEGQFACLLVGFGPRMLTEMGSGGSAHAMQALSTYAAGWLVTTAEQCIEVMAAHLRLRHGDRLPSDITCVLPRRVRVSPRERQTDRVRDRSFDHALAQTQRTSQAPCLTKRGGGGGGGGPVLRCRRCCQRTRRCLLIQTIMCPKCSRSVPVGPSPRASCASGLPCSHLGVPRHGGGGQ
jgi:hypothetical protein